jgi:hypothetical protein
LIQSLKAKFVSKTGSVSGFASILGSWQLCHNLCLGLIALLSIIGITIVGMPFLFLTKLAIYFWSFAFVLLLVTLWFYFKKNCISGKLVLFNLGVIIIGIPFEALRIYSIFFWTIGGSIVILSIFLYLEKKFNWEFKK